MTTILTTSSKSIDSLNQDSPLEAKQAITGAIALVDALILQGIDRAFCVPGESYLAVMDALYEKQSQIQLVVCRHEASAMFMAEAYAKSTGRPGICFVTRAPGAMHAAIGIHTAYQDSTPVILFIGQANSEFLEREAFQELDYRKVFAPIAKWVAQIENPDRVPEMISRAFHTCLAGRRGPVVISLPENMLSKEFDPSIKQAKECIVPKIYPGAGEMEQIKDLLKKSKRPLVVLGGSGWTSEAIKDVKQFVRHFGMPVACSFRRQDLFDNNDPHYVGVLGLGSSIELQDAVKSSDLLFLIGARMGEVPSNGYQLIESPQPKQSLVHVMPCAEELGMVYRADFPIVATMPEIASSLAGLKVTGSNDSVTSWRNSLRASFEKFTFIPPASMQGGLGVDFNMVQAWGLLREKLPSDVIITNGAGNYTTWAHRFFRYQSFGGQLAPTSGAMGYGLPAAIAAKLANPGRPVLCLAGDGCFMMSSHELSTAVQLQLSMAIIVFDNSMFGTIRMHQERHYPLRTYATDLFNPDFVLLAKASGAKSMSVSSEADLVEAVLTAFKGNVPTLIHVKTNPENIAPLTTIKKIQSVSPAVN